MKSIQFLLITALYSLSTFSVQQIKDMDYFNSVVSSGNAVIMFTTPTCGPCKLVKPMYKSQSSTQATLYLVNVDDPASFKLADKFNVRSFPTFLFLQNGKVVTRFITGEAGFQQKFNNAMQEAFGGGAPRASTPPPTKKRPPSYRRKRSKRQRPCGKECKCPKNKPGNTCCDCGPDNCQC